MDTSRIHALVTGGSRGIGAAIARQLAARGCRVAIIYRENAAAATALVRELPGEGHRAFRADMAQPDHVQRLWSEVAGALGAVDVVVNNAGIYEEHPPLTTSHEAWRQAWQRTLQANLIGPANLCHLAATAMVSRAGLPHGEDFGHGRIVNISSRGAFRGEPGAPAYGASKAGLNALSQSLAKALAPNGVYVFCIAPGWVDTDMAAEFLGGLAGPEIRAQHPLGRVNTADEVARAAVFCALDAPAAMTGAILDVNGASYLRT